MPIPRSNNSSNRPQLNSSRNRNSSGKLPVGRKSGGNRPTEKKQVERVVNPYDENEEDVFVDDSQSYSRPGLNDVELDFDENDLEDDSSYFDEYEDDGFEDEESTVEELEELETKRKQKRAFSRNDVNQRAVDREIKAGKNKRKKRQKNKKDTTGRDVFVDEKELKVKPFGKRKLKVNDFDNRKNKQKNAKIVSGVVIVLLVGLVGLGVKNAIVPPKVYSEEEIQAISLESIGYNQFPEDKGRAFVEDFMFAYLTLGTDRDVSSALSYFYTGTVADPSTKQDTGVVTHAAGSNLSINGAYNQRVVISPKVYDSIIISDNAASFSVRSLVQPSTTSVVPDENGRLPALEGAYPYWVSFNINVYYDSEKDVMYISGDSPTIIPNEEIGESKSIPDSVKLGNGEKTEEATVAQITPVINGFVQGYAKSSNSDISSIEQYLSPNADKNTKSGLGGEYVLAGSPTNAIKLQSFNTTNPNELKVLVKVDWLKSISLSGSTESLASTINNSQYVATVVKNGDKWEIQKFDSVKYVPDTTKEQ